MEVNILCADFLTKILKSNENIKNFRLWLNSPEGEDAKFVWDKATCVTLNEDFVTQYEYLCVPPPDGAGLLTLDCLDRMNAEIVLQTPIIPETPIFQMSEYGSTMKILKIKVGVDTNGKMLYPAGFFTVKYLEHIYCDDIPNNTCWMLILIEGSEIVKIEDMTYVQEITLDEARVFVSPYDKKITKIVDEGMIRAIEIKSRIGIALTDDEKAAIDPNNSTLGINFQPTFIELLEQRMGI